MPMDYVMEAASRAHFSGLRLASPDGLHLLSTSPPASTSPTAAAASSVAKSLLLPSPPVAVSPSGTPRADDGPRQPFVIGVSGGTASGKTTVCDMIIQQLHDHRVVLVNQDSFYRGLTAEESERVHEYNFDHPDAFDTEQLLECVGKLKGGQSVNVPIYDFKNHRRCSESFRKVNASDVIILEGILVFHDPQVRNLMDMKIFVDTDADIRLARRIRRDTVERGRDVNSVLEQYAKFVKPAFDDFVLPSKKYADVIIPRGGDNHVAIDLIVQHIRTKLGQHDLCKIYPNVYVIQSTFQIRGMHTLIRDGCSSYKPSTCSSKTLVPGPLRDCCCREGEANQIPEMVFVKAQKSKAYFKRFQVKYKRRRQGKTDYRARIRLINQDKNKYNTPKYRFVVRFTNKDIVAQIASASIAGDLVLASAYSHELPKYGLEVGLTNYAAAYCTGLLLARRVLKMLEMDEEYQGNVEASGEDFSVEPAESRRPFRALLDVGLVRTTTGNRVFGALKGALDGGLDIPHSDKRFAGFKKDDKQLDAEVHRKYIFGGHVAAYMRTLIEDEPEKYNSHFSEYLKKGIGPDDVEALYKKVHAAIRADPSPPKSTKEEPKEHKRFNPKKLTYEQRKANLIERLNALNSAAGGDDSDEDED